MPLWPTWRTLKCCPRTSMDSSRVDPVWHMHMLVETLEKWSHWIDEGKFVNNIDLDFSKAESHINVFLKASCIWNLQKWFLHGWNLFWQGGSRVCVNRALPSWQAVISCILQGSVTLFIIYINDKPYVVEGMAIQETVNGEAVQRD